uniref:Uncharacterized protein n=1 Tax=Timema monikensis TaxID=170555 RepID=A0A7R9HV06_9NEOP|nr:unnamed protein product [Timema monikensis]
MSSNGSVVTGIEPPTILLLKNSWTTLTNWASLLLTSVP